MTKYKNRVIFEVRENEAYVVIDTEEAYTQKTGAEMMIVTLASKKTDDPKVYGMTLWPREGDVPAGSPLGSMMIALGDDTSQWVGKAFLVRSWGARNCEIIVFKENKKKVEVK